MMLAEKRAKEIRKQQADEEAAAQKAASAVKGPKVMRPPACLCRR